MDMMNLTLELVEAGVQMNLRKEDGELRAYFENGFYKSDGCTYLVQRANSVFLMSRYDGSDEVKSLDDVVFESKCWYETSKDRYDGWKDPAPNWKLLYDAL
jgi:hypothetical protein